MPNSAHAFGLASIWVVMTLLWMDIMYIIQSLGASLLLATLPSTSYGSSVATIFAMSTRNMATPTTRRLLTLLLHQPSSLPPPSSRSSSSSRALHLHLQRPSPIVQSGRHHQPRIRIRIPRLCPPPPLRRPLLLLASRRVAAAVLAPARPLPRRPLHRLHLHGSTRTLRTASQCLRPLLTTHLTSTASYDAPCPRTSSAVVAPAIFSSRLGSRASTSPAPALTLASPPAAAPRSSLTPAPRACTILIILMLHGPTLSSQNLLFHKSRFLTIIRLHVRDAITPALISHESHLFSPSPSPTPIPPRRSTPSPTATTPSRTCAR